MMMNKENKISDEELKELLDNVRFGSKNHYIADCPICGKAKHFYINRNSQMWDCKKCGEEGNIIGLLSHLGKLFMLGEFKSIDRTKILSLSEMGHYEEEQITTLAVETTKLPTGFKRIYNDDYLKKRKICKRNFKEIKIGYTNLVPSLKDYIIFIIEEEGECKGYLSRYTKPIPKGSKRIKYNNARGVNFSHLLFGFDQITKHTDTVIVVEGLFDKISIDNYLRLHEEDDIKCVATFGKKISQFQVLKLQSKGIKNLILIYDEDAIKEMKKYSLMLNEFFNVKVGFTYGGDINDSSQKEVFEIFSRLKTPSEFSKKVVKLL